MIPIGEGNDGILIVNVVEMLQGIVGVCGRINDTEIQRTKRMRRTVNNKGPTETIAVLRGQVRVVPEAITG